MRRRARSPRRWALLAVLSLVALQGQVLLPSAQAASFCNGTFNGNPAGFLDMSATRGGSNLPNGASIAAGDVINLTTTWNINEWNSLSKVANCFQLNGVDVNALDVLEQPTANDGIFTYSATVPAAVTNGDTFCVRGDLAGQPSAGGTGTFKSNKLCWTVGGTTPKPDVQITKSASKGTVAGGESFSFTLTAKNVSTVTANNVVIADTVPSRFTVDSVSGAGCSAAGQTVTCNPVTLAPGDTKVVTINVTATVGACATIDNTATVTATDDSNSNNNSDKATVSITCTTPKPDVQITKSASKGTVAGGESFSFTLTAKNVSTVTANNVVIADTVPSRFTVDSVSGAGCSAAGQTVTCNPVTLAPGDTKVVTINVTATVGACATIDNTATVTATDDSNSNNNSDKATVSITCTTPDVTIRKSDGVTGSVRSGDPFTYTITVTSIGGATATDVVVRDSVPAGLTITGTSANCDPPSGQNVTCHLGDMAAGTSKTVTIDVKTTDAACPDVTNNATVTSANEPPGNQGNNTSNDVTTIVSCIQPGVAIRIVKTNDANGDGRYTDNEEAKRSGLDVPFKLVIINTGTPDLRITDLTDAFSQTTLDLLANKCPGLSGQVLSSGESVTCTFTLNSYSPSATSGDLVNTAEVCGENMTGDKSDCDNDTSRVRSAEVLGKTITPTPPGGTAFTGSNGTIGFGFAALFLLMLGSGLTYLGYRRRARFDG